MTDEASDKHSLWSSLREEYIEYAFLGELCREFWRRDLPVNVLRSHTDQAGFDIVMETGPAQRHVQIKSSFVGSSTRAQTINRKLEEKTGGCVVWIFFDRETLAINHYRWFGADCPRSEMPRLGDRVVKQVKRNAQGVKAVRPGHRALVWGDFRHVGSTSELASLLFPNDLTREKTVA